MAVILKNNKPRYIVVGFDEYDEIQAAMDNRRAMIDLLSESIIDENLEAFTELAE